MGLLTHNSFEKEEKNDKPAPSHCRLASQCCTCSASPEKLVMIHPSVIKDSHNHQYSQLPTLTASVQRLLASSMVTSTAVTTWKWDFLTVSTPNTPPTPQPLPTPSPSSSTYQPWNHSSTWHDFIAYLIFALCACPSHAHVPGHVHRQLDQVVKEGVRRWQHCQPQQHCHGLRRCHGRE